jgi:hypothetical protein
MRRGFLKISSVPCKMRSKEMGNSVAESPFVWSQVRVGESDEVHKETGGRDLVEVDESSLVPEKTHLVPLLVMRGTKSSVLQSVKSGRGGYL